MNNDNLRRPDEIPVTDDRNREYCDECGAELTKETRCIVSSLQRDISSANCGESATLCPDCMEWVT